MRANDFITEDLETIEIEISESSISGYVVSTSAEQIPNWLDKYNYNQKWANYMRQYDKIAFLNNLWVDEDARGEGIGSDLLDSFIDEASNKGAQAIFLSSDSGEIQIDSFNLVKWYETWDFEVLDNTSSDPLMYLEL